MIDQPMFRGSVAVAAGEVSWSQLGGGSYVRLFRDVYVPAGVPVTHQLRCAAATMIIPPKAVITGRSAATVRGVPLAGAWDPVEVVVAERDRFGPVRGLLVRRTPGALIESREWCGARLAATDRMGLDLALRPSLPEAVADLDATARLGLVDPQRLTAFLAGRREHGIRQGRVAVELMDGRAESRPESRVRVTLFRAGLVFTPQVEIRDQDGEVIARVDLGAEDVKLGIEYDGAWHGDPAQLGRDRDRLNRVQAAGWRLVFVTAELLRDPPRLVETVRAALEQQRRRLHLRAS
jgi:very-short-patch-repair endonuclease